MISMRTVVVSLLSFALTAFALPSLAQKTFRIQSGLDAFAQFNPGEVRGTDLASPATTTPPGPEGRIVLQNNSPTGNSNFNSFRVFAPAGFKIAGAKKPSDETRAGIVGTPATWAGSATDARNGLSYVNVTSISPSVNQLATFALNLKVQAGCNAVTNAPWLIEVYTGGDLKGQMFALTPSGWPTSTISGTSSCTVRFVGGRAPTSATLASGSAVITSQSNTPGAAGVQAEVMLGANRDTSYNGPITIEVVSGAALDNATASAVSGVATFGNTSSGTPLTATAIGSYTVHPKTASLTGTSDVTFLVSDKVLGCVDSPAYDPELDPLIAGTYFNASVGATDVTDTAWAFGFRGPNGKPGDCVETNFIATNNIKGNTVDVYDANGFKLPANAFSVVFDVPPGNDVVLAYTLTFKPQLAASNGLPDPTKKIRYCKEVSGSRDCTQAANLFELQGCTSPLVQKSSLPGTEPACLSKYSWGIVDPSECGVGNTARCLKVTIGVIDGKDPPIMSD